MKKEKKRKEKQWVLVVEVTPGKRGAWHLLQTFLLIEGSLKEKRKRYWKT